MSENLFDTRRIYPSNQEQYFGPISPITSSCAECKEFHEIRRDKIHLRVKSCFICRKEYAHCFCDVVCCKTTPGNITKHNYEYLTCDKGECDFLGVRCTNCQKLCKIMVSKDGSKLFWGCSNNNRCQFFKQHVLASLRNHVESCKDILCINADILCRLIMRYVDNLEFIEILKKLYNNRKLNNDELNEIKNYVRDNSPQIVNAIDNEILKAFSLSTPNKITNQSEIKSILISQDVTPTPSASNNPNNMETEEINQQFKNLENELKSQNKDNFNKLENEFKRKFNSFEKELKSRIEENLNEFKFELSELKEQNISLGQKYEKTSKSIENNFALLFRKLKIDPNDINEEESSLATRKSKRIRDRISEDNQVTTIQDRGVKRVRGRRNRK